MLLAAGLVVLISIVGGLLARLAVDLASGEGIWWAFLRLSDPGYLGDGEGTASAR